MQTDCFPDSPNEWPKGPVSELADINPRYSISKGNEYPFVEMESVGENFAGILRFDARSPESSGLSRFAVGDTLFAKITPCPQNGKIAFVSRLPDRVGLGSTEFIVLSPRGDTDRRFLYHLAGSHAVRGRAAARMEGSTGRQRVPNEVFTKRLLVPIPPSGEQAAIARILNAVDTSLEHTRTALERARALERSVLEDAFAKLHAPHVPLRGFTTDVRYGTSMASSERRGGTPVLRIPNVVRDRLLLDDVAFVALSTAEMLGDCGYKTVTFCLCAPTATRATSDVRLSSGTQTNASGCTPRISFAYDSRVGCFPSSSTSILVLSVAGASYYSGSRPPQGTTT